MNTLPAPLPAAVRLHCDMRHACPDLPTYLDDSGFIYCAKHGPQRRDGYNRCRKLTPAEQRRIQAGIPIERY